MWAYVLLMIYVSSNWMFVCADNKATHLVLIDYVLEEMIMSYLSAMQNARKKEARAMVRKKIRLQVFFQMDVIPTETIAIPTTVEIRYKFLFKNDQCRFSI